MYFIDFSIGFSDLYFDTVAVCVSILESPSSKYAVSVAYGNLIVSTVATCITWPLLLEFLCFLLSVLMFSSTLNAKTISLYSYLVYVHISTEDISPQTIKLYAAKTEFNIFTGYFFSYGDYLNNRTVNTTTIYHSRPRRQIKQNSFIYFIHKFNIISVSVTKGIEYFLVVDSVSVAYLLQQSIVCQHKHETIKIMTAWYSFAI